MNNKPHGKACGNCAFMEREHPHKQYTRIYCTNVRSEHCSKWLDPDGTCPLWMKWTAYNSYRNESSNDRGL